jgi:hypothetical protein
MPRSEHLQKIHQAVAVLCSAIPKMLVASAPEIPSITAHDFLWRKIDAAIHRFENIGSDLRKIGSRQASRFRFVNRLVFLAARESENRACTQATSDSSETENLTSGWQQCLHRATSDTFLVNLVARKFQGSRSRPTRIACWERQTLFSCSGASSNFASQSGASVPRCVLTMS